MDAIELKTLAAIAKKAAKSAEPLLLSAFRGVIEVARKPDGSAITELDRRAEESIVSILSQESSFAILSEESGWLGSSTAETYWVLDPLDGTTNFARGFAAFGTALALVSEGQVLLGVVNAPALGECFAAYRGGGAYLGERRLRVSEEQTLKQAVLFLNHGHGAIDRIRNIEVQRELLEIRSLRKFGSTALELASIAAGRSEGFICSGDSFWDYAAGICLVEEAGGQVTNWAGSAWSKEEGLILASNRVLHQELVSRISRVVEG